jgi:hypothetical protein
MTNEHARPTVVCLCGSTKFKKDFETAAREQTLKGRIVLTLAVFAQADGDPLSDEQITMLRHLHRHKIKMSDEIFIINRDGYIGESTRNDIEFAKANDMRIEYLVPVEE